MTARKPRPARTMAEIVAESRARQGLPPKITNPEILRRAAAILMAAPRPGTPSTRPSPRTAPEND